MAPIKVRKIQKALRKKGFRVLLTHHEYYVLYVDGKKSAVRTRFSHGSTEYSDSLLSLVAKQLCLAGGAKSARDMLQDLIDCPLTGEEYVQHLRETGQL